MSRLTERMHRRVLSEALAAVIVIAMFAGGAALAQDAEEPVGGIDAVTLTEMLQEHREIEYRPVPGALGVQDPTALAAWLEQQRAIEYADGLLRLTPLPYEWAGWLQARLRIEYPEDVGVFYAEVDQQ